MIIGNLQKALEELREVEDLKKFQKEQDEEFCKKYKISSGNLNFLLSIVSAERIKKGGML
jgi:hypothetical protein